MKHQKLNLKAVSPEDFDAKSLRRAAREGRLFIALPDIEPKSAEDAIDEILSYVGRISQYATTLRIGNIWEAILHDEALSPLFFLTRYSSTRGQINWYRVAAVVCLLREKGIYQKDISGMGPYLLDVDQIGLVREILDKNRE